MNTEQNAPATPPATATPAPGGGAPLVTLKLDAPDKPDGETISMPSEAFKDRLSKAGEAAQRKMLKDLGFEKSEDVAATLKALRAVEEQTLSEHEKTKRRIKELEPKEAEAKELSEALAAMVDDQFQLLSEKVREAIDDVAKGNARDRMRLMKVMKAAGLGPTAAAPAANGAPPPPAGPVSRAAPGGPPPPPSGGDTKFAEWQQMRAVNPSGASIFFQMHKAAIEATRPADQ